MESIGIQQGMDVLGSNGDKIGTVADVWAQPGTSKGAESHGGADRAFGGGEGAMGDQSDVGFAGTGGGTGSMGQETEAPEASYGGGPGAMGENTEAVASSGSASDSASGAANNVSSTGGGVGGDTDVVVEVVEVDVLAANTGSSGQSMGNSGEILGEQIPPGYEANPYASSPGYFKVQQGGFLGMGATDLYIPFAAIRDIVPGKQLSLSVTKADADSRFANKPAFLVGA